MLLYYQPNENATEHFGEISLRIKCRMGEHDGHRERVKQRVEKEGLENFQNHEVLEFLLFPFVPRKDTCLMAHRLINTFGGFHNVFNATPQDLEKVEGVTHSAALFLSSLPQVFRKYQQDFEKEKVSFANRGEAVRYLKTFFSCRTKEAVYAIALDKRFKLIGTFPLAEGFADSVALTARQVADVAMRTNASALIIAHNHPSGSAFPSQADFQMTNVIACNLHIMGINLCDHIIFAGNEYYSFAQHGLFSYIDGSINKFLKEGVKFYELPDVLKEERVDENIFKDIKFSDDDFNALKLDEQ